MPLQMRSRDMICLIITISENPEELLIVYLSNLSQVFWTVHIIGKCSKKFRPA